eukprot:TRINITY_DN2459_c0_g1_i3.p1 TRINITY_DN2459_c0_g1~~TRINITY_DN2459_c0_g1_i3.p1  ORF type:complete len:210 (-),score=44.56 TRINITY_DN2459_c0_g1_i3:25-654(-)
MLMLGDSVLHSRLPSIQTRMVTHYNRARPLGYLAVKSSPVFVKNRWYHLITMRVKSMILAVLTSVRAKYSDLEGYLAGFEKLVSESGVVIPKEAPPMNLRQFAGRDTIAFVYRNMRTHTVVCPELRPGPGSERKKTLDVFSLLFSKSRMILAASGVSELTMTQKGFRFHYFTEGLHEIYVLYTDAIRTYEVEEMTTDIVKKVVETLDEE